MCEGPSKGSKPYQKRKSWLKFSIIATHYLL